MDIFERFLIENKGKNARALTDPSFNALRERGIGKDHPDYEKLHEHLPTNTDLATYGDAVIKLCLTEILLDNVEQLSEDKAYYECDKYLVDVVGRHYGIIDYIDKDDNLPRSYNYSKRKGKNKNPLKYIATAVEAVIGQIYRDTSDLGPIIELLKEWMKWKPKK